MPAPVLDFRNTNSLWCGILAETLFRGGVRHAVISPGSRSTPIAFALAAHPGIEAVPVLDERSAAFFALGLSKRTRMPAAVVCTSGTAAANFFPAVVEAQESGVPLLLLTADRPPELRACASGQAIDQQKLYGDHVNFFHEFAVPSASLDLFRYLRQMTAHACSQTQVPAPGPVHLNLPFRDPLPPVADGQGLDIFSSDLGDAFFAHLSQISPQYPEGDELPAIPETPRGIILAGSREEADPKGYASAVGQIASALGWPVLADALSPLRSNPPSGVPVVSKYDVVLRSPSLASAMRPQCVLVLEGYPTSKVLREWLQNLQNIPTFLVAGRPDNRDAIHGSTIAIRTSVQALARSMGNRPAEPGEYARRWHQLDTAAGAALAERLDRLDAWFEGSVSRILQGSLPSGTPLFAASSMPVRDLEYFWDAKAGGPQVYFNRGANGIDGTLSTALGIAHRGRPTVLLTGDLALLHDTNGFLIRPKLRGSLTIVLINNRGGGIFEHLPVAGFDPPFEEFVAMPQEADFARLAAAYGVGHVPVENAERLARLVSNLPPTGIRILEIRTDRKKDAATRRRLFSEVPASLV